MADKSIQVSQIPPGELLTYVGDIASGALAPEDIRLETISFTAVIGPNGQLLSQSPDNGTVQIASRYNFVIEEIHGSIENPRLAGAAASLVKFNLEEQGRNFTIFKRPVDFATLVESSGQPYRYRGTYICVPGTQFQILWFVDPAWPALVGGQRRVTVSVTGTYIACEPTQA